MQIKSFYKNTSHFSGNCVCYNKKINNNPEGWPPGGQRDRSVASNHLYDEGGTWPLRPLLLASSKDCDISHWAANHPAPLWEESLLFLTLKFE